MSIQRARDLRKTMPPAEAALWNALRALKSTGLHFRRQVPLGRYYADFASHHPRIVIEVMDGLTPRLPMTRSGMRSCRPRAIVLRVTNEDVLRNLEGVVRLILNARGQEPA